MQQFLSSNTVCSEDFHVYEIYKGMYMRYITSQKKENIIPSANNREEL